ncbi:glycosyltransferase family 2 protein [Pseudomonas sp. BW13M1]|uniref:Glycosyltransferase family 2 protein n=1 Tax=Pseudomonas peradeniyensis TaxID=2745488 RepID=A0A923K1A3_9PSED|nr:glycosyltransferase family 2 protein [Pseudomonas peradeniyensis]MBV4504371.1 glycosyltransferase family 2 protein [Pseudomonas peradeniyensis]
MYKNLLVAVVIPCYNEEQKIANVISTMPSLVDRIYLVDDASQDDSIAVAEFTARETSKDIVIIRQPMNSGVGAAICQGYKHAYADNFDLVAVMAGDGQMDPEDLECLLDPLASGQADYAKGNRFKAATGDKIPTVRLFGNLVLSALTKIVSGYWHVSDTQCGYTVINRAALGAVQWDEVYPRYGCPNDILTRLNIVEMRVIEVSVKPRYGVNWTSKMKVSRVIFPILALMWNLFVHRMYRKYIYMSGHPIVLYYLAGALFMGLSALLFSYLLIKWAITGAIPMGALIMFSTTLSVTIQLILNAFSLDFQVNKDLCVEVRRVRPRHVN